MKFKVAFVKHVRGSKVREESDAIGSLGEALHLAAQKGAGWDSVYILRDSEGADHPDNRGKFLLYQVVKG